MRHLFPALQKYAWLNAAASSPIATPVSDAAAAIWRDTVENGDLSFEKWLDFKEALRDRVAALIGAGASQVAFTASTSMGFHAVAELLFRRGVREVVTLESEFPSTTVPLLARGLSLRVVKARPDGTYRVEDLEGGQAIALSAVQFGSGFTIDVRAVGELARARKVPFALNVAQALGQVPIDVRAGVDFLCGTSHKWMMAGYGTGLLYIAKGWLEELGLPWANWFSPPESMRWQTFPGVTWDGAVARGAALEPRTASLEAGAAHWPALYAFGAALKLIEETGVEKIHAHNLGLQKLLRDGLTRRGFQPNAPAMSGICVVRAEGGPQAACDALFEHGVVVTPRAGGVRFSTHVYNDESDVQRALDAIDRAKVKPATSLPAF